MNRILMIDNYDSFTYNLVHYLNQLNAEVIVKRHDQVSIADIESIQPSHILISPGPKTPNEAGISLSVIEYFKQDLPIFGVCLGHQAIAQTFGGHIVCAPQVMHGKTSAIFHDNLGVFETLPQGLLATRYHSLVVEKHTVPECLTVTAWTKTADGQPDQIMAIQHKDYAIQGVQFHPESIKSQFGLEILGRFLEQ